MAEPFSLGTDPEALFVVKRTGKIRNPVDIIYDPDPHDEMGKATAIGKDGNRDTSSFELRPGRSDSAVVLVNRCGELLKKLHKHYHPKGIVYKAGAYVHPEPLGGHIHLSWPKRGGFFDQSYSNRLWQMCEILKGFRAMSDYLIPHLFNDMQVVERLEYAKANKKDFAYGMAIRPGTLEKAMEEAHVEYRYPPSWLDTPEAAYCFLGGAEFIVREVFDTPIGVERAWGEFVHRMYTDSGMAPPNSPPLADALTIARQFVNPPDFMEHWVD